MTSNKHTTTSGPRAVLYLRMGTMQAEGMRDAVIESQRRMLYEHAATAGYDIIGEHCDEGLADTAKDRPAFQMCMARLRAGEADVLIVSRLDRIGRNATDIAACLDELDRIGVSFVTVDAQVDLTMPSYAAC